MNIQFKKGVLDMCVLAVVACPLCMKRDPQVSQLPNALKLAGYPVCVLLVIGAVIVHYVLSGS